MRGERVFLTWFRKLTTSESAEAPAAEPAPMRLDGVTLRGPIPFRFQCPAAAAVQFGATESFCKACDKTIHHLDFGEDLANYRGQCVKIDRQMLKMGGFIGARRVAVVASSEEAFANEWAKMLEAIKVAAPKLKGRGRDRHNTGVEVPRIITDSDTLLMADHALPNTVTKMFPRLAMMLDNSSYSTDIGAEERLAFHKVIVTPGSAVGAAAQEDVMKSNTGLFAFEHILVLDGTTAQPLKQIGALRPALDVAGKYRRVADPYVNDPPPHDADLTLTRISGGDFKVEEDYVRAAADIMKNHIRGFGLLGILDWHPARAAVPHADGRPLQFDTESLEDSTKCYAMAKDGNTTLHSASRWKSNAVWEAGPCGDVEELRKSCEATGDLLTDGDAQFHRVWGDVSHTRDDTVVEVSSGYAHFKTTYVGHVEPLAARQHCTVKLAVPSPTTEQTYPDGSERNHREAYFKTQSLFRKLDGYILGTQSYIQAQARVLKSDKSEARATERDEVQRALSAIGTGRRFLEKEYPGGLRLDSASMSEKELMESATADEWKALSDRCQAELDAVAAGCVPVLERIEAEREQN